MTDTESLEHISEDHFDERICLPLIHNYKKIHDNVHGYISISNYACRIIDCKYFQQLRTKKQLSTAYYVYPNAVHTRFEHSIGTYYLASQIMNCILKNTKTNSISDYMGKIKYLQKYFKWKHDGKPKLDNYICELVKIGALCHDIGHGPFSHLFDDYFLPFVFEDNKNIPNITHEERSEKIIELIIKSDPILKKIIIDDEIEFIKHLINPKPDDTGFLFQIVSNNLNGLDVDKYDYLARDSKVLGLNVGFDSSRLIDDIMVVNNNICYMEQTILEIYNMFSLRYNLHKMVYSHKSTIAYQLMITEIMKLLDSELKLSESINNLDKFILYNDDTIFGFLKSYLIFNKEIPVNVGKAIEIMDQINSHKGYFLVDKIISQTDLNITKKNIVSDDKKSQVLIDTNLIVYTVKLGFVSGSKKHPFDNIYSYSTKSMVHSAIPEVKKVDINNVSLLIPKIYQEYITMFYYKDRDDKKTIKKLQKLIQTMKTNLENT